MDRVAVGLHLGAPVCGLHHCQHCSAEVNALGRHGLSYRQSVGRHFQHAAALNEIVNWDLIAAHVPSRLEPTGLLSTGGKRPDGVTLHGTLAGWSLACLRWNMSWHLRHLIYNLHYSKGRKGCWECGGQKGEEILETSSKSRFTPIAIETMGAIGPESMALLNDLGGQMILESGELRSTDLLFQRLFVAVQRGNCASVLRTSNWCNILFLLVDIYMSDLLQTFKKFQNF